MRICILSPDPDHREYAAMWPAQRAILDTALERADLTPDYRPWTGSDPLADYDLVLALLAWGYHDAPGRWLAQLDRWETEGVRIANPAAVLRWNCDKRYLVDFAARGAAVVPTLFDAAADTGSLERARGRFGGDIPLIAKPCVSAGARGVTIIMPGEPLPEAPQARPMLFQPMLDAVRTEGEYSLFYFAGRFSHAILKTPKAGDFRVQTQHGGREIAVEPPAAAVSSAEAALALVDGPPLYARVDLVAGVPGEYLLMELELIEPQLFLERAPDGGKVFAEAVRVAAGG